jgi:hypothetical protein
LRKSNNYRGNQVCDECFHEYRTIIEGTLSQNSLKRLQKSKNIADSNPLFAAFKKGWEYEEDRSGLVPMENPDWIRDRYDDIYQSFSNDWKQSDTDFEIDFQDEKKKCLEFYHYLNKLIADE